MAYFDDFPLEAQTMIQSAHTAHWDLVRAVLGPSADGLLGQRHVEAMKAATEAADRIAHLESREKFFAEALGVADAGQYRNDWAGPLHAIMDKVAHLERERDDYREALEKVLETKESCVFSTSRSDTDGNEAFMEGSNIAFGQAAEIATEVLAKHGATP